ncbi:hypothetical protein GQ53DRAFT_221033 [Thozetella sp. PMI_491]|nr:hypothetical protein GQ53DRAFT_221033 [Thozetella sp. PMI_491]
MAQRNTSNEWTGPSAREMISTHTLAQEVIARHNDPCPVFDDDEITRLRRFVQEPTQARDLLREFDMLDTEGDSPGTAASSKGSLAGYIIASYGTEKSALSEGEVRTLKEWFDNGGGKTTQA